MSQSNPLLIDALRITADRLESGARYEWGHMGRCNCGHLVQTITQMSDYEIVAAVDFQLAEWSEHAQDYCTGTGHKVDALFLTLQQMGFGYQDVIQLENLNDRRVLARMGERTFLRRNCRTDAVRYMRTLAEVLEED
jgi:hypothetical protein